MFWGVCVTLIMIGVFISLNTKEPANNKPISDIKPGIKGDVEVWLTTTNQKSLLSSQQSISPSTKAQDKQQPNIIPIAIDEDKKYQQMDGFGASLTDASAWLIYNVLDDDARDTLMSKLFTTEEGIGISFLRQPMGASDFALEAYTYDDVSQGNEDFELEHFSIDRDKKYIIPLLKDALARNPQIKVMASPWSPPAWMKTSDSMIGGMLRTECYEVYANYFVQFIKAYEAEGIPIYAVTVQNEPLYTPSEYPGMEMQPYEQAKFIQDFLGPAFRDNSIQTKIICYDHNWDNPSYPKIVLENAGEFIAGTAWHCYGGTYDAMTEVYEAFPDKEVWFTEASGGEWVPPFNDAFADQMMHVVSATRNYAKTVVWWNIALDQNNGPQLPEISTCRGLVTINSLTGEITYNVDYYTMGHISKFVQPGAYRIESDNYHSNVESTAFKNPDGSIVLILSNRTIIDRKIEVVYKNSSFDYELIGKSAVTFIWN